MMNKTIMCIALSTASLLTTTCANAALSSTAILNFNSGVLGGYYGNAVVSGSYFGMDSDSSGTISKTERIPISQKKGLFLGTAQAASGSHGGAPGCTGGTGTCNNKGNEAPGIDNPWGFFGNTGMHFTATATNVLSATGNKATVDFSGWNVTWNGITAINMGGNAWAGNANGVAIITCAVDCSAGDTYTLDYSATVPVGDPSGFGGVLYDFHLEGTISSQPTVNIAPLANNDKATVDRWTTGRNYTPSVINILKNDTDPNGSADINKTTVTVDTTGTMGKVVVNPVTGNITYTPLADSLATDTFTYVVSDKGGPVIPSVPLTSNSATVTITVQNAIPVAADDTAKLDTSSVSSVAIDVTKNDTDSDGTIKKTTVTIDPNHVVAHGKTAIDSVSGVVTYTPNKGYIGTDSFQYTVEDNDKAVSNLATVTIVVSAGTGILPKSAFLIINAGTGKPGGGSYFTMEVNPGKLSPVGISGFDGISLGVKQPASVAMPDIDNPWKFFGNQGVHQTTKAITILTDDKKGNVTLDFSGWNVSWNKIPSIPMSNGDDHGIATMTCGVDCKIGDTYSLIYHATVPPGDPSGFGGVHYIVHLVGTIADKPPTVGGGSASAPYDVTKTNPVMAVDNSTSSSPGSITIGVGSIAVKVGNKTGTGLTAADTGSKDPLLNSADGEQCIGGCVDFIATGVGSNGFVDMVFKLSQPLPQGAIYRKLINGKWTNFNTSNTKGVAGADQVGTANADASGNCQSPQGKYNTGLRKGASCVFLRIYDGGPNDADGVKNGTIVDPSGALLAGSPNVPPASSSGCSISPTPVSIVDRADWLIVAAFLSILGLLRLKRRKA